MKHIVIDARQLRTSTGRYIERLLHYLQQIDNGHRYTILLKPQDMDGWEPSNPNFTKVACPYREFSFGEQLGMKRQLDSLAADLVHFPAVQQPVRYNGRVVTTIQDLTTLRFRNPAKNPLAFTLKQHIYRWVNHRAISKSKLLITPSEFVKQDVIQFSGTDPAKITVTLESADDLPQPAEPVNSLVGKRYIMYVGRATSHKNLERMVLAFGLLQKDHPELQDLHLALAGKKDANYQRIENEVIKQGIPNIILTGFVSDQQLRWMYEHCQAYIFPSLSEGFGLPGLEAMRHNAPVVSSNATCLPEVHGDAALYFDPLDTDDIASKIHTMVSDEQLRQAYIAKGAIHAATFSWQRMAQQTLGVYKKVLDD